jgi:hypothetical protein
MFKHFLNLLFLFAATVSFSQSLSLKGKVTDPENVPLESATVYLTSAKDSTVVDYTITNRNGNWEIKTRKTDQPMFLKISFVGFSSYNQKIESVTEDVNFGTIKMSDKATELGELVINGEIPPIRIKSDTLEFNASSFKVRPDANVEALLKQLPGVEIDEEGKIKVNGKEVNQILVNGKPFFDKDGKIALQNLPAEIIDKVQVSDTKTKKEELSGEKASGNNASINLTIQEDKDKGFFGKAMAGYGSDSRYESSLLLNYFKGKRKFSILGSSNNINSTGFSMNEIFDNMGGGRNQSMYINGDGGFGINGMQFGGNRGITQSNMLGVNYADEWVKDFDSNFNYFYTDADTENTNRTRRITLLPADSNTPDAPQKTQVRESSSEFDTQKFAHNLNTTFEVKIDSTSNVYFEPRLTKANSKSRSTSAQTTRDQDDILLNESSGSNYNDTDNSSFQSNIEYFKSFRKKGRSISLSLNNENNLSDNKDFTKSDNRFYSTDDLNGDGLPDVETDIRDQYIHNRTNNDNYDIGLEYKEPVADSLNVLVGTAQRWRSNIENRKGFNFDAAANDYTTVNDLLTSYMRLQTRSTNPFAGINLQKEKFSFTVKGGLRLAELSAFGTYLGTNYRVDRNYMLPYADMNANIKFTKSMSMYFNYDYNVDFPQARQLLPIEDLSSPLITYKGNENLAPNKYHSFYLGIHDFDFPTRTGYGIYAGGSFRESEITSYTRIEADGKQYVSYTNVSGTAETWFGGNWSKSIKKEAHKLRISLGLNNGINLNKGFTNQELYKAVSFYTSPRVNVSYDYGELLTINPSYNFTYNETRYTNYGIDKATNFIHQLNLQTTSYWPKHIVFGNDFGYTYNSNLSGGFRKDFFLWNTSLGYNFLKDRLLFKVKVYDLLNQNLGTSREITQSTITDTQNMVLKRYIMFSLTFKLQKFGGKESKEGGFWFF